MNLRTGEKLGLVDEFRVDLNPWQTPLFALTLAAISSDSLQFLLR